MSRHANPVSQELEYLKLQIVKHEIIAAEEYLIKSSFLDGEIQAPGSASTIIIRGITNRGIDLVENAVEKSENKDLRKVILGKDPVKIGNYITTCFRHPVAQPFQKAIDVILPLLQGPFPSG